MPVRVTSSTCCNCSVLYIHRNFQSNLYPTWDRCTGIFWPVEKWQVVCRSTFRGTTFKISTQNLIGLAPTVHYFTPLTRKPHTKFTGPPRSYLTFCKRERTITKLSNSSIIQNPRFSAPDAAHNSQVHTAAIICVHALLKIGPNRIYILPTHPWALQLQLVMPCRDKYSSFRSSYRLFLRYLWLVLWNERWKCR